MSAAKGKVDLDATREQLTTAGLAHAAERLGELLEEAAKTDQPTHRFLDRLLAVELTSREERRIKTSLRLSGLPTGFTLGNFDFGFQPGIEKSRIETLATCGWIREHACTLFQGPPDLPTYCTTSLRR
jgi:DNA replication protein DnaC